MESSTANPFGVIKPWFALRQAQGERIYDLTESPLGNP